MATTTNAIAVVVVTTSLTFPAYPDISIILMQICAVGTLNKTGTTNGNRKKQKIW